MAILFKENFENGNLGGFKINGLPPTVATEQARVGTHCMKSYLAATEKRAEVSLSKIQDAVIGYGYWYGFSIFLLKPFEVNSAWESVANWHARPDFDIGETWRSAPMSLNTAHPKSPFPDAEWILPVRWDSRKLSDLPVEGEDWYSLGPYETGVWTDWVFHVKWSYESDGFLEVWKNGVKVLARDGPNCYNDEYGPYFKMGIYRAGRSAGAPRTIYHDEFRMADANGTYEDVAPGGKSPEPKPPISGTAKIIINIPATQITVIKES
ncbi:hypothetical protein LCGC14_2870720 [marine sediment metagenome]|uniref:3-keto-disaccharide hydrolase domain-containing protein n=1 Tax=marine sediment metagenome TaxID=412755 RepID=A0A0F8Y377_9ZZZZ